MNGLYGVDFCWYRVAWPCETTPFEDALHAVAPANDLSVTLNTAGTEAIIKAPAGVSAPSLETYSVAPTSLMSTAGWEVA